MTAPGRIPFVDQVDNELAGRHMSRARLVTLATIATHGDVPANTITATLAGRRYPTLPVMEAVAQALNLDAFSFPEYRLAVARAELDERTVGMESALNALERQRPRRKTRRKTRR